MISKTLLKLVGSDGEVLKNMNTGHKAQKKVNLKWVGVYSLSLQKTF